MKFLLLVGLIFFNLWAEFEIENIGDIKITDISPTVAVKGENTKVTIKGEGFNENTKAIISPMISEEGKIISNIKTNGYANSVTIKDNIAYVADDFAGLTLIDISDPKNPTQISNTKTNGWANSVTIKNNIAYVADGNEGLTLIDISDSKNPIQISNIKINGYANSVTIKDNIAYVADGNEGLTLIDISNPKNLIKIDNIPIAGNMDNLEFIKNGKYIVMASSIIGRITIIENPMYYQIETKVIDSNTIEITCPDYKTLGYYNLRLYKDNNNYAEAFASLILEDKNILNSIDKINSLAFKIIGEEKETYEIGETISTVAYIKHKDNSFDDIFIKTDPKDYVITSSNPNIANFTSNSIKLKNSGEVTVKLQTKTQEGLLKFKVIDENGTFEKNKNPLNMIIVVGRDNEAKKLEKAFIKNGNDLYLFALTLTDSENIKYFNSISKEQIIADIDKNFGKDNVVLNRVVNFENIKETIENMPYSTTPLLIHIIGHGSADLGGKVMLEEEYLPAVGLKKVLDDYQVSTNRDVIVVVDACYSGAFANTLANDEFNRLIITSVNADETAIMAPLDGTSYSKYLKDYFELGNTMGISFDESSRVYRNLVNQSLSPTIKGNEVLQNFKVPNPKISSGLSEVFLNYTSSGSVTLNETKELFVKIKLSEFERKTLIDSAIYAKVIPPQEINLNVDEFEIPTIEIEKVILEEIESDSESVTYKTNYTFDKEGIYSIAFAIENNMQNTIETTPIKIEVGKESKDIATLAIEENKNESDNFILKRGWNLVASPIKEGIEVKELNITSIWSYINEKWENSIDKLEPNRGYWIKTNNNQSYKFSGIKYKIDFNNLEDGWNLVGSGERVYKYEFNDNKIEKLLSYDENWTNGDSEYFHYLDKAKGVWIKVSE